MTDQPATLSQDGDVSIITLDDGKANVFSKNMSDTLEALLDQVPDDKGSLLFTATPGLISAGFHLKTISGGDPKAALEMTTAGFKLLSRIYSFPRPVIAALSGHTIAMGLFVACGCDYRIGLKGDFVTQANEVRNNMDIPTRMMKIAASRISKRHAYSVLLHADPYPFVKAVDAGIIDELVDEPDFDARVMEKAADLATLGHPHYEKTKNAYIADDVNIIKPLIIK